MLSGIWILLVTPSRHGQVNAAALRQLVCHYEGADVSGFVVLGTTDGAALLLQIERYTVLETTADACGRRTPFLIGVGATDTRDVCAQIRHCERWNSTGYLVSPPYYVCSSQAGLYWYYAHVAANTARPVVLYNVPKHTGASIAPDTALVLAEQPNIITTKEYMAGHSDALQDGPLDVLSGDDSALLGCLAHSGTGGILADAHLRPELPVTLVVHRRASYIDEARRLASALAPPATLPFAEPSPAPVEVLLSAEGRIGPDACVPILPVPESLHRHLLTAIRALEDVGADCRLQLAQLQRGRIRRPCIRLH